MCRNKLTIGKLTNCKLKARVGALRAVERKNHKEEKMRFYGREKERTALRRELQDVLAGDSRFVLLTGRRGIGKTCLVFEALGADETPLIYFYVSRHASEARCLALFCEVVTDTLGLEHPLRAESFEDALRLVLRQAKTRPIILFFDELQNFGTVSPSFFGILQSLWNETKRDARLLLVAAGSESDVLSNLFRTGRATLIASQDAFLDLSAFSPALLKAVLQDRCPGIGGDELLALYALTGGVQRAVEALLGDGTFTVETLLERFTADRRGLLTEATMSLETTFSGNRAVYYDILRWIAAGETSRSALVGHFREDISGHLNRLEHSYRLIERVEPVGETGSQRHRIRFEIADELLHFFFAFLEPKRHLLEAGRIGEVCRAAIDAFPAWSERILKRFYRRHFESLDCFTEVGPWWDRKALYEIDLIAVDERTRTIVFCDIRRDETKAELAALRGKAEEFLRLNPKYASYRAVYRKLSLAELGPDRQLLRRFVFGMNAHRVGELDSSSFPRYRGRDY